MSVSASDGHARPLRGFSLPCAHVPAAAWIEHQHWRTGPGVPAVGPRPIVSATSTASRTVRHFSPGRLGMQWSLAPSDSIRLKRVHFARPA